MSPIDARLPDIQLDVGYVALGHTDAPARSHLPFFVGRQALSGETTELLGLRARRQRDTMQGRCMIRRTRKSGPMRDAERSALARSRQRKSA